MSYTPSTEDILDDYIVENVRNYDSYQTGRSLESERQVYRDRFHRWLDEHDRQTAEKAWDSAVRDTFGHSVEHDYWTPGDIKHRNPYRKETNA